jgi:TrpR-related protein YerC/YecD
MNRTQDKWFQQLCQAFMALETEDEVAAFLDDLCTIKEAQDMSQRLQTAIMLDAGLRYNEVTDKIGTSSATISRVNKCLNYGAGGYRVVLDRMREKGQIETE